jgi:hypothetical protein
MADQTVVCVLGMHRSGTSLVTRLLNLLGVDLGPEESLMQPTQDNAGGYWEHPRITNLNDDVLARLGGTWDVPPRISAEAFAGPEFADLRRTARRLVASEFAGSRLWGWKDPRTCLVLPFWQLVVPSARYVICLRNPSDVARSMARAIDKVDRGLELWLRYASDALTHTRGHRRLLVFHEDVMRDWRGELGRLASFIGAKRRLDAAIRLAKAEKLVDQKLWRNRTTLADSIDDPRVDFPAKALYLTLVLARRLEPGSGEALPHATLESFAAAAVSAVADRPQLQPSTATGHLRRSRERTA